MSFPLHPRLTTTPCRLLHWSSFRGKGFRGPLWEMDLLQACCSMYGRSNASVVCTITISSSQRRRHEQCTSVPANHILERACNVCILYMQDLRPPPSPPVMSSAGVKLYPDGARGTGVGLLLAFLGIRISCLYTCVLGVGIARRKRGLLAGSRMFPLPRCVRPLWDRGSLRCRARARGSWRGGGQTSDAGQVGASPLWVNRPGLASRAAR